MLNNEKTGDSFPKSMTKNELRDINIKVDKYFYPEDSARRYDANKQTRFWLKIPVGDVAGKRARQEMINVKFKSPDITGDAEMKVAIPGNAYATAVLDDEWILTFD
jgi:hypothetical protein